MNRKIFEGIYKSANIPVIICEDNEDMTVYFANIEARLLFSPSLMMEIPGTDKLQRVPLNQVMRFSSESDQNNIRHILKNTGLLNRYPATVLSAENAVIPVKLSANTAQLGEQKYIIIYLFTDGEKQDNKYNDILVSVLNMTYHATDIDHAVRVILSSVGEYINVSRVYIFEDLLNNHVSNTYEWCAVGVKPEIDALKKICKDDYHRDIIVRQSGMLVASDVKDLPEADCTALELQGVKAVAILPLYHQDKAIGYMGYDDCRSARKWASMELTLLKGISSIVSSLIIRRNAEADIRHSHEALKTISDNIEPIIYVNDVETYKLKFVNRSMAEMFGTEPGDLIGKYCWEVLQKGMDGPCPFCPIPKLLENGGKGVVEWEHQNTVNGVWFWVKDSIIQWIDGKAAHLETAIDVTLRKQYEKQLQHYASTDALTGVFNREWGKRLLQREHEAARAEDISMSLCFIDIDGLKYINDSYGHEAGDEAIRKVCDMIHNRIRKEDLLCRWGGDEFIALIKCESNRAAMIMQGIQKETASSEQKNGVRVSFSYGLVDFTASDSVDAALAMADSLMYANKNMKQTD